jgi:hypothetical protein
MPDRPEGGSRFSGLLRVTVVLDGTSGPSCWLYELRFSCLGFVEPSILNILPPEFPGFPQAFSLTLKNFSGFMDQFS